jgi:methionyl-tRNA formyltransferase
MKVLVTAGYDKSKPAIALCEQVKRSGHEVAGILVVTPFNFKRLRKLLLQRGLGGVKVALGKLLQGKGAAREHDYMGHYLHELDITNYSLRHWAVSNNVAYQVVDNINSNRAVDFVVKSNVDALVYGGGGILRSPLISAANRAVINPHCGPLPEIRGMNAIEWAVVLSLPLEVTVHFIDEGIDTGDIISRVPVEMHDKITIDELRSLAVITGINEIARLLKDNDKVSSLPRQPNMGSNAGRQCYVMAPAIRELVAIKLQQ